MGAEQHCWRSRPGAKARRAEQAGSQLFIGGEMGIGNTTAAAAMACALLMRRRARWSGREPGWTPAAWRTRPR